MKKGQILLYYVGDSFETIDIVVRLNGERLEYVEITRRKVVRKNTADPDTVENLTTGKHSDSWRKLCNSKKVQF